MSDSEFYTSFMKCLEMYSLTLILSRRSLLHGQLFWLIKCCCFFKPQKSYDVSLFISLGSWFARLIVSSTLFLFFILHYMYYNLYAFVYWMFLKTVSHAVKRLKKSSLSLSLSSISIVFYGHQFLTLHVFF